MTETAADPFSALKMAAGHVGEDGTAKAVATGIAQDADLNGDIEAPAAQANAALSTLLSEPYAEARATGDEQLAKQAVADLDRYRADAGAFFEKITGGALPADAVAQSLRDTSTRSPEPSTPLPQPFRSSSRRRHRRPRRDADARVQPGSPTGRACRESSDGGAS